MRSLRWKSLSAARATRVLLASPATSCALAAPITYVASLNYDQNGIGSRAWTNPFTGSFPSTANNHSGHSHTGTSHRVTVTMSDLIPAQNQGATYFAEAQYISPTEYTWCQAHPGQCNMYNNASYRPFSVSGGPTSFSFSPTATYRAYATCDHRLDRNWCNGKPGRARSR